MTIRRQTLIGMENRARVRKYVETHLGATYKDICRGTGLSEGAVRDHMKAIKAEWRDQCDWRASTLKRGEPTQLLLFNLSEHEREMLGSPQQFSKLKGSSGSEP